jgi:hypothetical protein
MAVIERVVEWRVAASSTDKLITCWYKWFTWKKSSVSEKQGSHTCLNGTRLSDSSG